MAVNNSVRARLRDVSIVPDHRGDYCTRGLASAPALSADDLAELLKAASELGLLVNVHRFDFDSGC